MARSASVAKAMNTLEILGAINRLPEVGNSFAARAQSIAEEEKRLNAARLSNRDAARRLWMDIENSGDWNHAERFRAIFEREPNA